MTIVIQTYSEQICATEGLPMGGFAAERLCKGQGDLEINGIHIPGSSSEGDIHLVSVDTLYCGTLAERFPGRIFCASHTHFAPMLDANKPMIGRFVPESLDVYCSAIEGRMESSVSSDTIVQYRAEATSPVYRRFDYPPSILRKMASRTGAMYPNQLCPISRDVDIFVFFEGTTAVSVICYHANHPVARSDIERPSSDYIGAIRQATRQRFGDIPVVFFSGCSADLRPNITRKRFYWLPGFQLNRKFKAQAEPGDEAALDEDYRSVVQAACEVNRTEISENEVSLKTGKLRFKGYEDVSVPVVRFSKELAFAFVPFEVSHLFEGFLPNGIRIVSCVGDTRGYLPHPTQLAAGGYEVDKSRKCMGLSERIEVIDWEIP